MIEMTNEEILQLAEQHFDYQGGWIAYSKEDLLEFARDTWRTGTRGVAMPPNPW